MLRPARTELPRPGDRLALGTSGLRVSPICIGFVGSPDTIEVAFASGINFFFVSTDMHWPLYEPSRRGLAQLCKRGLRDQIVVAGASYMTQHAFRAEPTRELVRAIPGLERIDVRVAGGGYAPEVDRRIATMSGERGEAGERAIGVSLHDRAAVVPVVNEERVDIAFVRYNAGHPGARIDVFPRLARTRTLVYCFKAAQDVLPRARCMELAGGDVWIPTRGDHYRFAMSAPELDGLLCAPPTPTDLETLLAALAAGPLDADDHDHLIALAALAAGIQ